jgi:hypothetical protein
MQNFTNEQKAQIYNQLLFQYERIQEEVRRIKAESFELNEQQQRRVNELEGQMRKIYNDTQRLYK